MTNSIHFLNVVLRHLRRSLRHTFGSQVFSFFAVSLSILVFIFFYLLYTNIMNVGVRLNDEIRIVVYLEDAPTPALQQRLKTKIESFGDIDRINFVSSEEAYERLTTKLGPRTSMLAGLPKDFLPSSIEVFPSPELRSLASLDTFVRYLYELPSAKKVQYGQLWIDRFQQFMFILRTVIVLSAMLLIVSLTYTVAYTIRLMIAARKEELQYLNLIGASPALIQAPFVAEGALQGLLGSVFGVSTLYGMYRWSLQQFETSAFLNEMPLAFLSAGEIFLIIFASISFCSVGSFLAVRRYMKTTSTLSIWQATRATDSK